MFLDMKCKAVVEILPLLKMIEAEKQAEDSRYLYEIESPLSHMCESSDALGPLILSDQLGLLQWKLSGSLTYSRFRKGDRVEVRTQKPRSDASIEFSKGWKVDNVSYPAPGKIEVVISGDSPLNANGVKEVFLFKESSTLFNGLLKKRLREVSGSDKPILLDTGKYNLSTQDPKFKNHFEKLKALSIV